MLAHPWLKPVPVLEVTDLKKHFPVKKGLLRRTVGQVYAVDGISFTINEGETLGLVGESGCGKSTAGRAILRLIEPTGGIVKMMGRDIAPLSKKELRPFRQQMQIVFQDPFSSLNPRMTAGDIVGEPLYVHGVKGSKERQRPGGGPVRPGRAAAGADGQLPAPVLGRPAPAHRHRPCAGARGRS